MMSRQKAKFQSASSLAVVLVLLAAGVCLSEAPDQKSVLGELQLEGKYVERLVLSRSDGHREILSNPDETVKLPPGQYLLQEVRLKGGYTRRTISRRSRVTISEDKPALLKVGGPLKQTVSVLRHGRVLELTHGLCGVDGGTYTATGSGKRPTFSVYKGDRKIASGDFEFG